MVWTTVILTILPSSTAQKYDHYTQPSSYGS